MLKYRKIKEADDKAIAKIIRENLEKFHLDIPGTVYFDPELDHISTYYNADPKKRVYLIALDESDKIVGVSVQRNLKGFLTVRSSRNCIWMIPRREKVIAGNS